MIKTNSLNDACCRRWNWGDFMKNNTLGSLTWTRLMRFSNLSNQLSNEFLKRFELTTAQFDVLAQIYYYQPLTQSELAEKILVTQGGISRMLARLEQDGYIVRKQEWKTKTIMLSEKGRIAIERALPAQTAFQSSLFDNALSREELKELYRLLTKLYRGSSKIRL